MRFALTDEQIALKDMARRFLADHSGSEQVRAAMETEPGYDPAFWERMATELGLAAMTIPEEHGGLGLGAIELVAVMEEMGRVLACSPFFSTVCLGATAILEAGTEEQKATLLGGIAEGRTTATLAWAEQDAARDPDGIEATATPADDGFRLDGTKRFVVDGASADLLVVAARAPGSVDAEGIGLFVVEGSASGVTRTPLDTVDQTRRLAEVRLDGAVATALGDALGGLAALNRTLDLAAIALAGEQVGGAEQCLDMAVDYAKVRVQFGRPIGSFQAIKHKCADMMLLVESARSASYYAGWAAAEGDAVSGDDFLDVAAAMARAYCSDAFVRCAGENIQVHGGIGFTWEHDAHLYFKRAKASAVLFGEPADEREHVARHLGL